MGSKKRILVVEDEALTALELEQVLRDLGYEVVGIAARSARALELARQSGPDLVLMDITLAGREDGVAVAERVHAELGLPVVFLTAHTDEGTLRRAMLTEPFGYLLKPFQAAELHCGIQVALHNHACERERIGALNRRTASLSAALSQLETATCAVTHELRAALAAVRGDAEALRGRLAGRLDAEGEQLLERIGAGRGQLGQLADGLLAIARLGEEPVARLPLDMAALALEAAQALAGRYPDTALRRGALPAALGDPALLRHVWMNLLTYAFQASAGSAQAQVEIGSGVEAGETLYFVSHSGEAAHASPGGRARPLDGFEDPGLAIARRIAEAHGGRAWHRPAGGAGTTVSFTLGAEPVRRASV